MKNEIHFLQKIISHAWFVDHFTENNNFKHLHYLNKPVTVQKYVGKIDVRNGKKQIYFIRK